MITTEELAKIQIIPLLDTLRLQKIDDAEYFSKKYGGYISNSRLSLINPEQENDPKAFFEGLGKHNKYSDALIFGSAVHELCLQPDFFHIVNEVDRPTAKVGFMADELFEEFKNNNITEETLIRASDKIEYYKGKLDKKKQETLISKCAEYWEKREAYEHSNYSSTPIYLDPKSRERVIACNEALERNKDIQMLLHPEGLLENPISENEQAILLDVQIIIPDCEPFILRLKAKLDNYTIDKETNTIVVNDVKTIGKIVSEFESNFKKFHYSRELALYSWLLSLVVNKYYDMENCTIQSNCLVVSTIPKYYTKVYKVSKADFTRGWEEFKFLLRLVAYYYNKGYRFS